MEKILSTEDYKETVRESKKRLPDMQTNSSLTPDLLRMYIAEGRLYRKVFENGLYLLIDEGDHYNLIYYWKGGEAFAPPEAGRPVLLREIDGRGRREQYIRDLEPRLFEAGFVPDKRSLLLDMELPESGDWPFDELENRKRKLQEIGLTCTFGTQDDMEEAAALWKAYLEIGDIPLEHLELKETDKLFLIKENSTGRIIATYWWRNTRRESEGRHAVTHPDYYRKGIGLTLQLAWMADAKAAGLKRCLTWVSDTNTASLGMCQKAGLHIQDRSVTQYIAEQEVTDHERKDS